MSAASRSDERNYVTDQNNNKIWKITYDGIVTHFSGSSATSSSSGTTVGTATNARYNNPCDIVSDGTYLFVADHNNNRIIRVGLDGTSENFVGSTGNSSGYVDATGTSARFYYPKGLVIDSAKKHLYVCDNQNNRIRKINIETKQVTTIAGGGPPENSDGIGAAAKIPYPNVLVITKYDRYLYVGEFGSKLRNELIFSKQLGAFGNNVSIDKSSKYGLELQNKYAFTDSISVSINYAYIRAIIDQEGSDANCINNCAGNDLPGVSRHNLTLGVNLRPSENSKVILTQSYRSSAFSDEDLNNAEDSSGSSSPSQKTKEFIKTDLAYLYTYKNKSGKGILGSHQIDFSAKVENLFERSHGIWLRDDVIYPSNFTRNFMFGAEFKY